MPTSNVSRRLSDRPSFLLQSVRYSSAGYISEESNIAYLEAMFDYYRQLPGQPNLWYGFSQYDNPQDFYSRPAFIDGHRTEFWSHCFSVQNTLEEGAESSCKFMGLWTDPGGKYGIKEGGSLKIYSRWGESEWGCTNNSRAILSIRIRSNPYLFSREVFLDILNHAHVLWRSDIVGIVDVNSPVVREHSDGDAARIDRTLVGIVDGELFLRPELDEYFESRENSGES